MSHEDDAINELGRRLAAAYVSYVAGHTGVDRMLKRTPEQAGRFWRQLATMLFQMMKESKLIGVDSDAEFAELITKYIQ